MGAAPVGARPATVTWVVRRTWRAAWSEALYGEEGLHRTHPGAPGVHYRTASTAGAPAAALAGALARLAAEVDADLGHPERLDIVEVGAGCGDLLGALAEAVEQQAPALARRLHLTGVDLGARPATLPAGVAWTDTVPWTSGLLLGVEWLDDVPCEVVLRTPAGPRLVTVNDAGHERDGPVPDDIDLEWLARWWPLATVGDRAEVGRPRDEAWAGAVGRLLRGTALAVDYAHLRADRPGGGSLAGHRAGRSTRPVPDRRSDVTAAVAMDAVAAAGRRAGATSTRLLTQCEALVALGVTGRRPAPRGSPSYLPDLVAAGAAGALLDPAGWGGCLWLLQTRDG